MSQSDTVVHVPDFLFATTPSNFFALLRFHTEHQFNWVADGSRASTEIDAALTKN
jgi:hypothetical protein